MYLTVLGLICSALLIQAPAYSAAPAEPKKAPLKEVRLSGPKPGLQITPRDVVITDARDARRVLVTAMQADGTGVDVTGQASLKTTSDVVRIDKAGLIYPVKEGTATVSATFEGLTATFPVTVKVSSQEGPLGFEKDVMPVLSKAGCNSGACHGGAKGKNGFKLSLRGYDPKFDYDALINDLIGRRFNRAEPAQSLMLLKPTMGVAHGGGLRFPVDSRYYNIILQWIREGVRYTDEKTGRVTGIDVVPGDILLGKAGQTQQMLVLAKYADGSTRDVTSESVFVSSSPTLAEVTDAGLVKSLRKGEAAIQVRYQGQAVSVSFTTVTDRPGFKWTQLPEHNFIDKLIDDKLKRLKILPSKLCTDAEFIRRVSLDLTGLIPDPNTVRAFLEDPTESRVKRSKLVDKLLASPEYVDHWSLKWGDLLQSNRRFLGEKGLWTYRSWIRKSIADNKPYDQFVREIIVANGSTFQNPASNFFRVTQEPKVMMETVSQLFLGVRMMCANCHDHPFESWTQRNYYEMTAFFGGVARKEGAQSDEEVIYEKRDGFEVRHPKYGYEVPARFPFAVARRDGTASGSDRVPVTAKPDESRRERFANWLTSRDNPYFAAAISNRIWSYFLGRGIIDPVDDLRPSNPSSNPALLAALADELKKTNFDLRRLMRTIANSRTYQASYVVNEWNEEDETNFSHQRPRRLSAEQLLDAVGRASGSSMIFEGMPEGFSAQQLPDPRVGVGGFLDLFGRPQRESACECERRGDISLAQALNLVNGSIVADAVADAEGRVAKLLLSGATDTKIVEELYLATLSRMPDEGELKMSIKHLRGGDSRAERAQDLLWALLNSHAFLFNR